MAGYVICNVHWSSAFDIRYCYFSILDFYLCQLTVVEVFSRAEIATSIGVVNVDLCGFLPLSIRLAMHTQLTIYLEILD